MIYRRDVSRWVMVIALAFATSGCSLFWGKGRPHVSDPPDHYVRCTNVYGPIVVDGLITTISTVVGINIVRNATTTDSNNNTMKDSGAYTFFIMPAIFALSGIYGIVHVNDCSKHHEAWARLHPESPNGPPPPMTPVPPQALVPMQPAPPMQAPPPPPTQAPQPQAPQPQAPQPPASPAPAAPPSQTPSTP